MEAKFDEIIKAALHLNIEERAHLAAMRLLSLDEPSESEVERLWLEEAERRLNEFREAARYYQTEAPGVGVTFVTAVRKMVGLIAENP